MVDTVFDSEGFSSMYQDNRPEYPPGVFQYFVECVGEHVSVHTACGCHPQVHSGLFPFGANFCSVLFRKHDKFAPLIANFLFNEEDMKMFVFLPASASVQPRCGCRLWYRILHPPPGGVF